MWLSMKLFSLIFILGFVEIQAALPRVVLNERGQFVDEFGRFRMYHGFNSVQKSAPWFDKQILNETRLKYYKEWGFNVVRLGMMWAGVEPIQGQYNMTYTDTIMQKQIVDKLANKYGIYSLLDMHQDVLSSLFNGYDGIPLWLAKILTNNNHSNGKKFPFPLNHNKTYFWGDYYISYEVCETYQQLYHNTIAIETWSKFWRKIAELFRNNTGIIGYELINEPWVGNFYDTPELLLPGNAGRYNLLPVYDKIVEQIREIDNDTLVFYEPVTLGTYAPTTGSFGTGFDRVPGGKPQQSKSVLSYHYYCFLLTNTNAANNYSEWQKLICDNFFASQLFQSVQLNRNETGGGSFLTEFGECEPDGNPNSINTIECDAVLSLADQYLQSFTYWDSNFFTDDTEGLIRWPVVRTFARTYPRAIQGNPILYQFNRVSREMILQYQLNQSISAPTEIFIPLTVHYDNRESGFNTVINPYGFTTSFDKENFLLSVTPGKWIPDNTKITIVIKPTF